jgi:hypothetical protein
VSYSSDCPELRIVMDESASGVVFGLSGWIETEV